MKCTDLPIQSPVMQEYFVPSYIFLPQPFEQLLLPIHWKLGNYFAIVNIHISARFNIVNYANVIKS